MDQHCCVSYRPDAQWLNHFGSVPPANGQIGLLRGFESEEPGQAVVVHPVRSGGTSV